MKSWHFVLSFGVLLNELLHLSPPAQLFVLPRPLSFQLCSFFDVLCYAFCGPLRLLLCFFPPAHVLLSSGFTAWL